MRSSNPLAQSRIAIPYSNNNDFPDSNDIEYAKIVAKRIFEMYDQNKNRVLEDFEVDPIMRDIYRSMKSNYNPSNKDINEYSKIMDCDKDGTVTLADVEALCIKYLTGRYQPSLNIGTYNGALRNSQEVARRVASPSYLKRSGSIGGDNNRYNTPERYVASRLGAGYSSQINNSYNRSESLRRAADLSASPYDRPEIMKRKIGDFNVVPFLSGESLKKSGNINTVPEAYSLKGSILQKHKTGHIRRVFDKYDTNKDGYIDEQELKGLMAATFGYLGLNRMVVPSDIKSFLDLVDVNKDKLVSFEEYESVVVRGLSKYNIKLD